MRTLSLSKLAPFITRYPRFIAGFGSVITLIATFWMITGTQFAGDITENLQTTSPTYQAFEKLERDFHPFSQDETILLRTKSLADQETYQQFQDFLLDLQLVPQVQNAFSIFSLPKPRADRPDRSTPAISDSNDQAFSSKDFFLTAPEQLKRPIPYRLQQLHSTVPFAKRMLSKDKSMTLIVLMLEPVNKGDSKGLRPESLIEIQELAASYKDAFSISFVGIPEIQRSIRTTLHQDQGRLTIASTLLCLIIAWLVFRSWRAALICALPAIVAIIWFFGFLAIFEIPVDFLITIVPTMVIVISFADGIHLYLSIQRHITKHDDIKPALTQAIIDTGPACLLASLTTALAFIGIGLSGAETLQQLSFTGAVGVSLAFLSVIFILPSLASLLLTNKKSHSIAPPSWLTGLSIPANHLVSHFRRPILVGSIILSALLIAMHLSLPANFQVTDYLSKDTQIRNDEKLIEKHLGGSGQIYAIINDPDRKPGLSISDKQILSDILSVINKATTQDLNSAAILQLLADLDVQNLPEDAAIVSRFLSKDRMAFLLPIPSETMAAATNIVAFTKNLETALRTQDLQQYVRFAGQSLLTATETPNLIRDLQKGLIAAIFFVIGAIIIIVGSIRIGLACLLPNLIPILTVEAYFWIIDKPITMTAVIALTIAFGIAVDNSVHLLNQYQRQRSLLETDDWIGAMKHAITTVTPAALSTTVLLMSGIAMTQFSTLPSIVSFGQLVMTALFVALLADLFILPAFLLSSERKKK